MCFLGIEYVFGFPVLLTYFIKKHTLSVFYICSLFLIKKVKCSY